MSRDAHGRLDGEGGCRPPVARALEDANASASPSGLTRRFFAPGRSARPLILILVLLPVCLGLSGCAFWFGAPPGGGRDPHVPRTGRPYTIEGVTYYPMASAEGYVERGVASWYGPGFHGRDTANGEPYDQDAISAAHTTLPLPTLVRVTNLENGRQLVVRVNDRGPFVKNRLIDLSRGAAEALGFQRRGTALVQVEALGPGAPRRASLPESARIFVQVGAFSTLERANRLAERLDDMAVILVRPAQVGARTFYRVRLGPLDTVERADGLVETLAARGFGAGRIVVE